MKFFTAVSLVLILFVFSTEAAVFNVNTTVDCNSSSAGTLCLREAMILANTNGEDDQIYLPAGNYSISISGRNEDSSYTGDIDILDTVSIIGAGPGLTVIDGNHHDRIFHVPNVSDIDTVATISSLTIQNGRTDASDTPTPGSGGEQGGGIFNQYREVVLNNVVIQNNQVIGDESSSIGGGVLNLGTMEMNDCAVIGNSARRGGGIFNAGGSQLTMQRSSVYSNTAAAGGGMTLYGTFVVKNSTIYSNTADPYSSGGILVGMNGGGYLDFCTVADNTAKTFAGGIYLQGTTSVSVTGSIFSNNRDIDNNLENCYVLSSTFSSSVYNLEDGNSCGFSPGDHNLINTDPKLGPYGYHGGKTKSLSLLSNSPAINGIEAIILNPEDQRGKKRPKGQYSDIGAFEYYPSVCFPVRVPGGETAIICM